jgi:hypothetical protein
MMSKNQQGLRSVEKKTRGAKSTRQITYPKPSSLASPSTRIRQLNKPVRLIVRNRDMNAYQYSELLRGFSKIYLGTTQP